MRTRIERGQLFQVLSEPLAREGVLFDAQRLSKVRRVDPAQDVTYQTIEQRANFNSNGWSSINYHSETVTHHLTDQEKQRLKARTQFGLWLHLREQAGVEGEDLANDLLKRTRQPVPEEKG